MAVGAEAPPTVQLQASTRVHYIASRAPALHPLPQKGRDEPSGARGQGLFGTVGDMDVAIEPTRTYLRRVPKRPCPRAPPITIDFPTAHKKAPSPLGTGERA